MAIGDISSAEQPPIGTESGSTRHSAASVWRFAAAAVICSVVLGSAALVDPLWRQITFRIWFVIPAGQIILGSLLGAVFGATYRATQKMPVTLEFTACAAATIPLVLIADWFNYKTRSFVPGRCQCSGL